MIRLAMKKGKSCGYFRHFHDAMSRECLKTLPSEGLRAQNS